MSAVPVPSVPARDDRRIDNIPVGQLRPYPNNARKRSKKQVRQIADSIGRFGFNNPVLIGVRRDFAMMVAWVTAPTG
jgi:hypothetical protein